MKTKHSPMRGFQGRPLSKIMLGVLFLAASLFIFQRCTRDAAQKEPDQLSPNRVGTNSVNSAQPLPGGRPNYVVCYMGGNINAKFSCIRTMAFNGSNGTVAVKTWSWNQTQCPVSGGAAAWKKYTGYTTAGCAIGNGSVRTPLSFEPGASGGGYTTLVGVTYYIDALGHLVINYTSGNYETWTIVNNPNGHAFSRLDLYNSSYLQEHGWGFGSQAALTGVGATIAQIKALPGGVLTQQYWSNDYGVANKSGVVTFYTSSYDACGANPTTMRVPTLQADKCDWWNSYISGNPATDGRKNYANNQLGTVTCPEAGFLCPPDCGAAPKPACTTCTATVIGAGGGHTVAMLQVLDDSGNFQGWVAAEASFDHRSYGGDLIGCTQYIIP